MTPHKPRPPKPRSGWMLIYRGARLPRLSYWTGNAWTNYIQFAMIVQLPEDLDKAAGDYYPVGARLAYLIDVYGDTSRGNEYE